MTVAALGWTVLVAVVVAVVLSLAWVAYQARRCPPHDYFPEAAPREFLPTSGKCRRCGTSRVWLPYGQCLTGHPLADHYDAEGRPVPVASCLSGPW